MKKIDKEAIRKLRAKGKTYEEIGELLGCSRQYCEQVVHSEKTYERNREFRERNRDKRREENRKYYRRNKDHIKAMQKKWKLKNPDYWKNYNASRTKGAICEN